MSPLRMPQSLGDAPHVDTGEAVLRFELLEELDASVGRCERELAGWLKALRFHDAAGGDAETRGRLVDAAWRLIVQHEACDCCDHQALIARHNIPAEVLARVGARH
jgi:hypothetical protein